jgi:biopolymer transport protein ExbB
LNFVIEEIMENSVVAAAADAENPYGLTALWRDGGPIAQVTLIILLIMSAVSWYIIFSKLWDQRRLRKGAKVVEKQFWSSGSLKEAVDRLPKDSDFRTVAEDGLRASAHHEGRLTDRIDLHEWVTMSLQRSVDSVNSKLSNGLAFLATVGSTAPFVGLFGTVVGIINAFKGISTEKSTGLGAVAGGISEALVTTAIGLFVAIPAVWMFNYFTSKIEAFDVEMGNSSSELIDYFIKRSQRGAGARK